MAHAPVHTVQPVTLAPAQTSQTPPPRSTTTLAVLDGFVGLTAAGGALFIVPRLSPYTERWDYLFGLTGATVGLGLIAVLPLGALYGLLTRRSFGPTLSILAGTALAVYELAQSFVVGNLITPQPGLPAIVNVAVWLQPISIALGLSMILLGGYTARASTRRPHVRFPRSVGFPAAATASVLAVLTMALSVTYGWAASATGMSMGARIIAWSPGSTYDWSRFPSRPLPASTSPALFAPAPKTVDLTGVTGSSNPDQFFSSSQTTALLVIQHDRLVLERYYNGANRSSTITAFSDTKSWDSALVGAAIAAGYIHSINDPVTRYIPELARRDPRFAQITLRDLLDMHSGLAWDTSGFIVNDDSVVYETTALRQAVLSRVRIVAPPGRTFRYNDFNPLLLGIVLERATHRTVTQWLDQTLWGPMGAQYPGSFSTDSVTGGFEKMPSGLNGAPIDLMRIGVLYLHGGNRHGHQLIPRQWVKQSTDYASASASRFPGVRYGLGWWTRRIDGMPVYYAWGNKGEYVLVVPSLDIVVARFGRQFGFGAPRDDSSGGSAGVQTWPTVLTRIAQSVAATRS